MGENDAEALRGNASASACGPDELVRGGGDVVLSRAPAGIHGILEASPSDPCHTLRTRRTEVKTRHGKAVLIHARKARNLKRKRIKRMHTTQTTSR